MVQFNALSYVWGSPEKTASMVCNGLNVAITQNLHDALTVIRTYDFGTDFLWVDQVCINQSDEQEKAVQVQHMLMFYERAMNTVAWLGD
ncbi:heterokaryon incompatibility, partial [Polyplosphaeria fusca]